MTNGAENRPPYPGREVDRAHSIPAHLTTLIRHFNDLRDGVDLHNLVFQADYRIIPAVTRTSTEPPRSI